MAMGGASTALPSSADVVASFCPELGPKVPNRPPPAVVEPSGFQSPPREVPPDTDQPKRTTSANGASLAAAAVGRGRGKGRGRTEDESSEAPLQKRPKPTPGERAASSSGEKTEKVEKELRYQASLARALSHAAQAERREVRERLRRDSLRLGTFSRGLHCRTERDTALTWQGGTDWEDLELLRKRIQEQKQQIEKLQQSIKGRQKLIKKTGDEAEELEEELWEHRELCGAKFEALKRDESDLKDRERRLHIERLAHFRQFRSIETEDHMSFTAFQPLVKRYQLLRLQHKTSSGNTEVYQAYDVTMLYHVMVKIHHLSLEPASKAPRLEAIGEQCEEFKSLRQGMGFASLLDHFELEGGSKYVMVWECCEGEPWDTFILHNGPVMEKEARGMLLQIIGALRNAERGGFQLQKLDLKPSRLTFRGGEVKINSACFPQLRNAMARSRSRSNMEVPGDSAGLESPGILPDDDLCDCDGTGHVIRIAGAMFYELLFGHAPHSSPGAELELPESPRISQECRECLSRMFDRETHITVQDIYSDPFLAPTKRR